jgi:hypothetical protein
MTIQEEPLTYVMTEEEFKDALIAGAIANSILPPELNLSQPHIRYVVNGVLLEFGPALKGMVEKKSVVVDKVTITLEDDQPVVTLTAKDDGPTPEEVKTMLLKVMTRAPKINTIANWSPEQRKEALAWAQEVFKTPTNSKVGPPSRPSFIIEPAARGSKKALETTPPPPPSSPPKHGRRRPVVSQGAMTVISETYDPTKPKTVEEDLIPEVVEVVGPSTDDSSFFEDDDDGEPSEDASL